MPPALFGQRRPLLRLSQAPALGTPQSPHVYSLDDVGRGIVSCFKDLRTFVSPNCRTLILQLHILATLICSTVIFRRESQAALIGKRRGRRPGR
jgi:hypothetical protein